MTIPERQVLTRIAKGCYGRRHRLYGKSSAPAPGQVRHGTDEAIGDALDVSVSNVGRWRCQAVAWIEDTEAVLERQAKVPHSSRLTARAKRIFCSWLSPRRQPARRVGRTLRALARELEVRGIVPRISYEAVRCALKTN